MTNKKKRRRRERKRRRRRRRKRRRERLLKRDVEGACGFLRKRIENKRIAPTHGQRGVGPSLVTQYPSSQPDMKMLKRILQHF